MLNARPLVLGLIVTSMPLAVRATPRVWEEVTSQERSVLFVRSHPSGFEELRVETTFDRPVQHMCKVAWGSGKLQPDETHMLRRDLIEQGADYRITYEQVRIPVVTNRDFVVEYRRLVNTSDTCRITFRAVNNKGPKPHRDFVRITEMHGEFMFTAAGPNSARLVYLQWADPGGDVPSVLVRGARRDDALAYVERLRERR